MVDPGLLPVNRQYDGSAVVHYLGWYRPRVTLPSVDKGARNRTHSARECVLCSCSHCATASRPAQTKAAGEPPQVSTLKRWLLASRQPP